MAHEHEIPYRLEVSAFSPSARTWEPYLTPVGKERPTTDEQRQGLAIADLPIILPPINQ